jgi:hypothetical protein
MAYTYGNGRVMSAQEAQGKNTNAIMAGWVDRGPWQYWDTINSDFSISGIGGSSTLAGAPGQSLATSYSPFSIYVGQQNSLTGGTKNKKETNMTRGNQFPPPRCLLLIQIGFYFSSQMIKPDIDKILDNTYIEFKIDEKVFHEGQIWQFPGGAGLMGVTSNAGESVYTLGVPSPRFTRRYDAWSKYIAPIQQFSMLITVQGTPPVMAANGVGIYMPIYLDGLTDRSVQ